MKLFRSKDKIDDASIEETLPSRRRQKSQGGQFRVGYTIAGESRQKRQAELERSKAHKKKSRKNRVAVAAAVLFLVILVGAIATISIRVANEREAALTAEIQESLTPSVDIIDQNANTEISSRVTEFVARLEADAKEYNLEVERVVLPYQKAREVHVYLVNHAEYYKMTIERGSTVQIEDAERMMRYLDGKGLAPEYVDIRVEGKAYFK